MGFLVRLGVRVFAEVRDPVRMVFALGVAALAAAYAWLRANLLPFLPELDTPALILGAFAIIFAGVALSFAAKVLHAEQTDAKIYLDVIQVARSMIDYKHQITGAPGQEEAHVVRVVIKNNPVVRSERGTAKDAHAEITIIEPNTGDILRRVEFARWSDAPQPGQPGSPATIDPLRYRDLAPNDASNVLDIAMFFAKAPDKLFTFNNDFWTEMTLDKGALRFKGGDRVLIRGVVKSSTAPNYWFEFFVGRSDALTLQFAYGPSYAHWLG